MPIMTNPLAHFEMLLEETKSRLHAFRDERMKIDAKVDVLNDLRYSLDQALDAERQKLSKP